jgi:predicted nucleotidyltransferase
MGTRKILKQIHKHASVLHRDFHVQAIYIFGSIARGEGSAKSDVDLLVDFYPSATTKVGIFEFVRLKEYLEFLLKRRVDLVARDALKDWMKAEVEKGSIRAA